jgi:hypothetical protein
MLSRSAIGLTAALTIAGCLLASPPSQAQEKGQEKEAGEKEKGEAQKGGQEVVAGYSDPRHGSRLPISRRAH